MARIVITQSDLLDALAAASTGSAPEDARTLTELAAEAGISKERARKGLHALQLQRRLVVHRVPRLDLAGRAALLPAYTILPAKKARA